MTTGVRETLWARRASGARGGITSICSAHPVVIEVALARGLRDRTPVLIEATCNQVNQEGGYTGMRPRDVRHFVEEIADRVGFARDALILGGDHLGPHPWKQLPAAAARPSSGWSRWSIAAMSSTRAMSRCRSKAA